MNRFIEEEATEVDSQWLSLFTIITSRFISFSDRRDMRRQLSTVPPGIAKALQFQSSSFLAAVEDRIDSLQSDVDLLDAKLETSVSERLMAMLEKKEMQLNVKRSSTGKGNTIEAESSVFTLPAPTRWGNVLA